MVQHTKYGRPSEGLAELELAEPGVTLSGLALIQSPPKGPAKKNTKKLRTFLRHTRIGRGKICAVWATPYSKAIDFAGFGAPPSNRAYPHGCSTTQLY